MNRLDFLTILIVSLCILAIVLLISRGCKEGNMTKVGDLNSITDDRDEDGTEDEETISLDEERLVETADASEGNANTDRSEVPASADAEDERVNVSPKSGETNTSNNSTSSTTVANTTKTGGISNVGGPFLVLGGTYEFRHNAENEARRLRKAGYEKAEATIFNGGKYAIVLVDRFYSRSEADELVEQLKAENTPAMVLKKRAQ